MAETFDLMATAYGMLGNRIKAVEQLGQAIELFRSQNNLANLSSSLAMRAIQAMPGSNETTFCSLRTRDKCVEDATEALNLAQKLDSLPGQAFAQNGLGNILLAFGEFGAALLNIQEARRIATEIEHQQWLVATSHGLGQIYLQLLAPNQALTALESGVALAKKLGSGMLPYTRFCRTFRA
jgi:tetratricopeptide (TPR) repeat protein